MRYVALLRGINVGGNKKVLMADLKKAFEKNGYPDVKTLLNSGNVVFTAHEEDGGAVKTQIEQLLEKTFGFSVPTLIRPLDEIQQLVADNPFHGIEVKSETRLYVTFLSDTSPKTIQLEDSDFFRVIRKTEREVCTVLTLSPTHNTIDLMANAEKAYGKSVTTRNWNTIIKLANL